MSRVRVRVVNENVDYDARMLMALLLYSHIRVDEKGAEQMAAYMGGDISAADMAYVLQVHTNHLLRIQTIEKYPYLRAAALLRPSSYESPYKTPLTKGGG